MRYGHPVPPRPHQLSTRPLIALIGVALLLRALIPAGWMPMAGPDGITLQLCSGRMPRPDPAPGHGAHQAGGSMAHAGMQHGDDDGGAMPTADQPCAFAGFASAAPPALAAASVPPPAQAAPAVIPRLIPTIGRGMPAPPPPATGPPTAA